MRFGSDGVTLNSLLNKTGRSAGGWIRGALKKFTRDNTSAADVTNPSSNDGLESPDDVEAPEVVSTFEQLLQEQLFCEACLQLNNRENHLFQEITDKEDLKRHQEELEKLAADHRTLEELIQQTVQQSLCLSLEDVNNKAAVSAMTTSLTSAVKAIYQQEEQDLLWRQARGRTSSNWKNLHDSTLSCLVEGRMDNPSVAAVGQLGHSSIQTDIQSMGRQMTEDLLVVVNVVKNCYPPESNICQLYASLYHQTFSARLRKITDFVLGDKDSTFLLRWVNEYYPGILKKPELVCEIDSTVLGKLLPRELLEPLEEQYLMKQENELSTYMNRVLDKEKDKWSKGEEPTKEDGCCSSPLAYDIIQFINGMVTAAERVTGNLHRAQKITYPLTGLIHRFKGFQEDVIQQNKRNSQAHVIANLDCTEQFRDVLQTKGSLFPEDVQRSCLSLLQDMKHSAHVYLSNLVHKVLKPQYQKLGTSDWLKKNLFEQLLSNLEQELQELQSLPRSCRQELIGKLHQEVTEEYVRRLLRGEVKLRDKEQQQKAFITVTHNAESLCRLFNKMGSNEDWLKEILLKIAEVLKLQDIPAIQMQIISLGSDYPDLSERHISALLKLKTNVSKSDRKKIKSTLSDTLNELRVDADARLFFSRVEVK